MDYLIPLSHAEESATRRKLSWKRFKIAFMLNTHNTQKCIAMPFASRFNQIFFTFFRHDEYEFQHTDAIVYVHILFHLYQIQRAVWSIFPHYIAIQMNTVILFALTLNLTLIKRSHRTQQCSLCERTLGKKTHRNRFAIR